jgi:hypothetical protein
MRSIEIEITEIVIYFSVLIWELNRLRSQFLFCVIIIIIIIKRHDIFAKIIHMNLAVKFNLLKNTQPHYSYTPESCLENDSYKLYFVHFHGFS